MKCILRPCFPITFSKTGCIGQFNLKKIRPLILALFLFAGRDAFATAFIFSGTGNWDDAARWSPSYPGVTVASGHTITITGVCTINVAVSSASNVTVSTGTLTVDASLTTTALFQQQSANALTINGTLTVDGTAVANNGSTINISTTGQLTHSGTTFTMGGNMTNNGGITVEAGATLTIFDGGSNAALVHNGTSLSISGTLTTANSQEGAPITVNAGKTLTINSGGTLTHDGGTAVTISGTLTNDGTVTVNASKTLTIASGGTFTHNGTAASISGTLTNNGTVTVNASKTMTIGGNFGQNGTATIEGTLTNNAALSVAASKTLTIESGGTFIHNGTNATITGTLTNNGTVTVNATKIMNRASGGIITNSGTINGTGTITSASGAFSNPASGTLAPGTSPGCFAFGNTGFTNAGTIVIEADGIIACSGFDQINVTGVVTLSSGGTLNAAINVASPVNGQLITFINGSSTLTGTFTNISPALPTGWSVVYNNPTAGDVSFLFTALPVELVGFEAILKEKQTRLDWQTASETNNRGFEIERSANGIDWQNIGFEKGNGTTTDRHDYSFLDEKPLAGQSFYRLRQLDFDGKSDFSNLVSINRKSENGGFTAFPNPTDDGFLTIFLDEKGASETTSMRLFDGSGRLLETFVFENVKSQKLDLRHLPTGVFWLEILNEKGRSAEKIIRQ